MRAVIHSLLFVSFFLTSCNDFDIGVQNRVFGFVTDAEDQPVNNARLNVSAASSSFGFFSTNDLATYFTNNEGFFEAFLLGVLNRPDSYLITVNHPEFHFFQSVNIQIFEDDFINRTFQLPKVRLFPVNSFVNVSIQFNLSNQNLTITKVQWLGDLTSLGSHTPNLFISNRAFENGTFTLKYTVFNRSTNQEQTFELTRTLSGSNYEEFISI